MCGHFILPVHDFESPVLDWILQAQTAAITTVVVAFIYHCFCFFFSTLYVCVPMSLLLCVLVLCIHVGEHYLKWCLGFLSCDSQLTGSVV